MRNLVVQWIHEGVALSIGEELFIPTDAANQKQLLKQLKQELVVYSKIDPVGAAKLQVTTTYKDKRYWFVIKKIYATPLIAYRKGLDGGITKVTLLESKEQERIKKFMEEEHRHEDKAEVANVSTTNTTG